MSLAIGSTEPVAGEWSATRKLGKPSLSVAASSVTQKSDWRRAALSCVLPNHFRHARILRDQLLAVSNLKIRVVEPRRHGCAHQRELAAGSEFASLPNSAANHHLRLLSAGEIASERDRPRPSNRQQLQHDHRIAQIEVENLRAWQAMQGGERLRRDYVVDRRPDGARAASSLRQVFRRNHPARAVGFAQEAALNQQRLQLQQLFNFVSRHDGNSVPLRPKRVSREVLSHSNVIYALAHSGPTRFH